MPLTGNVEVPSTTILEGAYIRIDHIAKEKVRNRVSIIVGVYESVEASADHENCKTCISKTWDVLTSFGGVMPTDLQVEVKAIEDIPELANCTVI